MWWSDLIFIWGFALRKIDEIPVLWTYNILNVQHKNYDCLVTWEQKLHVGTRGHQVLLEHCFVIIMSSEHFLFNKNSGLKFWKFHSLNGMIQSAELIWPKPLHVWYRMQKSGTGDNNFVKWKGAMKWPDWSKGTTFKGGRKYSKNLQVRTYLFQG